MESTKVLFVLLLTLAAVTPRLVAAGEQITLTVLPHAPILTQANVSCTWTVSGGEANTNSVSKMEEDWISVWWTPFKATYVAYMNVTSSTGTFTVPLLNARHPYVFRYYRKNTILAESAEVHVEGSYPTAIRLSLVADDENKVRISWTTNQTISSSTPLSSFVVEYGQSPDALNMTAVAVNVSTYTHDELNTRVGLPYIPIQDKPFDNLDKRNIRCQHCWNDFTASQLYVDPGTFIDVVLEGLQPEVVYYYRVGQIGGYFSAPRMFKRRPVVGPQSTVQILYVADGGIGSPTPEYAGGATHNDPPINGADKVWEAILQDPSTPEDHIAILNGDLSYARGWPMNWEVFHQQTSNGIFDERPLLVTMGNHEYDYAQNKFQLCNGGDSGGEAGLVASRRFHIPLEDSWYYQKIGPLFLLALSSEHSVDDQLRFVRQVLNTSFDRTETPWLVAMLHRPIFSSNFFGNVPLHVEFMKYADLFTEVGVDVVLVGHDHYYERMCAISSGACNTWGFRDVWKVYEHAAVNDESCFIGYAQVAVDIWECRAGCLSSTSNCTGIVYDQDSLKCQLLGCDALHHSNAWGYSSTKDTAILTDRLPGTSPVYIVDGSAGAEFSPYWTLPNPLTVYKDFLKWGYSRMIVNATHFTWNHFHVSGRLADEATYVKQ
jgi:hypothetical protein